jgi:hypothetical protein
MKTLVILAIASLLLVAWFFSGKVADQPLRCPICKSILCRRLGDGRNAEMLQWHLQLNHGHWDQRAGRWRVGPF